MQHMDDEMIVNTFERDYTSSSMMRIDNLRSVNNETNTKLYQENSYSQSAVESDYEEDVKIWIPTSSRI